MTLGRLLSAAALACLLSGCQALSRWLAPTI
ncbi:MAG: hypothetical protein RI910_2066 [Verrucomicrobiota bacterium]|jgi:hypothetical protein